MADAPSPAAADLGIFSHVGEQAAKDRAAGVDPAQFIKEHSSLMDEFRGKLGDLVKKHFGGQ